MFKKKKAKSVSQNTKTQTKKPTVKKGKTPVQSGKPQNSSDAVLAKLKAIEREMSLEEARDRVDQLEDEKIAANIEQLLKLLRSGD